MKMANQHVKREVYCSCCVWLLLGITFIVRDKIKIALSFPDEYFI